MNTLEAGVLTTAARPPVADEPRASLGIDWVKVGGLFPPNTGGRLRSLHILEQLSRRHRLRLFTTHGVEDDPAGLRERLPLAEVHSIGFAAPKQGRPAFAAALAASWLTRLPVDLYKWRVPGLRRALVGAFEAGGADVVVADFLSALPNLPHPWPLPVALFEHNVEHVIWRRLAEVEASRVRRLLLEFEWRKLRRFEAAACREADRVLTVSEADRASLERLAPQARVEAIPTGVDVDYFRPDGEPERPNELVFTGSMDWYPNEDAILHFVREVLPLLRRERPDVALSVVGRNPGARLRNEAQAAGVRLTGRVADVRPHVAAAAVYVVPLRVGGGTRLKIFEALAMGKAVVSTTIGAEGLPLVPDEHYVRADSPEVFARAVAGLLRDAERRRRLGRAGRRLVEERYSWRQVALRFEESLRRTVSAGCAVAARR